MFTNFAGGRHAPAPRPEPRNPYIIGQKYGEVCNQKCCTEIILKIIRNSLKAGLSREVVELLLLGTSTSLSSGSKAKAPHMWLARSTGLAMVEDMVEMVEVALAVEEGQAPLWRQEAIPDLEVSWLLAQVERGGITNPLTRNQSEADLSKSRHSGRGFPGRN